MAIRFLADTTTDENIKLTGQIQSDADVIIKVDANNDTSGSKFEVLNGGNSFLFRVNEAGNATIASDLTVTGGDITLSGTGRIQGIDTVTAGTDAASKNYVDTQVAGVPQGTVTSVGATAPITSSGGTTPTIGVNTAAVSSGSSKLATGTQIQDAIDGAVAGLGTMSTWKLTADSGGTATIDDAETVDIAGGTNITTVRSGNTVTINTSATTNTGTVTSVGITPGTGISVSGSPITGSGSITVTNSAPDQTVALTAGTGITITGTYPNFTITNSSPSSGGTVTGSGTSGRNAIWNGSSSLTNGRFFESNSGTFLKSTASFPFSIQNDGGVTVAEFEGSGTANVSNLQISPGTQTKPGLNFGKRSGTGAGDTNTGIYSEASDQVNISAGGSEVVAFSDSGIHIGILSAMTSSPSTYLTVDGTTIKTRTVAQVRDDIGAGTGTVTGTGTSNTLSKWTSSSAIGNSEITDTGSLVKIGSNGSGQETLYIDTDNRKVGFRTSNPGAAFDVNGTIRVRNQLNVGDTSEQNLFVNGGSGGQFVKFGNYGESGSGSQGNYFGITSSENQPKFIAAFGDGGKVVQAKRVVTIKLTAAALNDSFTNAGKILIPAQGTNNIIWPTQLFIYRGPGSAGTGWTSGTNVGATFYFCESDPACNLSERKNIAVIAGGVCSASDTWFWGRPVPLPTINENPNVRWKLDNKPLRFRTNGNINNATMDWYIRIEYIQMNVTAGLTNNVDITVS